MKTIFVRKPGNLTDVLEGIAAHKRCFDSAGENCYIAEEITLSEKEWASLTNSFLEDRSWIADFSAHDYPIRENDTMPCIRVTCKSDSRVLIIDPEGYDYARYVGIGEPSGALK